jgi:hypothetical protein
LFSGILLGLAATVAATLYTARCLRYFAHYDERLLVGLARDRFYCVNGQIETAPLEAFLKLRFRILQATGIGQLLESVGEKARNTCVSRIISTIEQDRADDSLYGVRQCRVALRTT